MRVLVATRARRRTGYVLLAVLGAAAMFASGALLANAIDGDGAGEAPAREANSIPIGNVSRDDGAAQTTVGPAGGTPAASPAIDRGMPGYYGCLGSVGDVLTDGRIDPGKVGFAITLPKAGFALRSIQLRAEAICGPDGQPQGGAQLVLDSSWMHSETGLDVSISQRRTPERTSNVRYESQASFWSDGYSYTASVNSYRVYPADTRPAPPPASSGSDGSSSSGSGASPSIAPGEPWYGKPDPRAAAVLDELLAQLAPDIAAARCYYTQRMGSWADIIATGVGDPRGAIPSGYSEAQANFTAFDSPARCDAGPAPNQVSFAASFVSGPGGRDGTIYVNGNQLPAGSVAYPGNVNEYSANWSNGTWQFSVGARTPPAAEGTIRAIARALDPGFDAACLARQVRLGEAELAAIGAGAPASPAGWKRELMSATRTELTGNCTGEQRQQFPESSNVQWMLTGPDNAVISASGYRISGGADATGEGYISEGDVGWSAANGWRFAVSGYNQKEGTAVAREVLIAVAKGMDPALDPSKLRAGGGSSVPPVKPAPAEGRAP